MHRQSDYGRRRVTNVLNDVLSNKLDKPKTSGGSAEIIRGTMMTGNQSKAVIPVGKPAKGPRKKRARPEPRQYTIADLERARDRVGAAERRIENERSPNSEKGRAGLKRAQLELYIIESQLRLRGLLER